MKSGNGKSHRSPFASLPILPASLLAGLGVFVAAAAGAQTAPSQTIILSPAQTGAAKKPLYMQGAVGLNPQPEPPSKSKGKTKSKAKITRPGELRGLNPQPEPPSHY